MKFAAASEIRTTHPVIMDVFMETLGLVLTSAIVGAGLSASLNGGNHRGIAPYRGWPIL